MSNQRELSTSSSDSESVEIVQGRQADIVAAALPDGASPEFWMVARQTQCGASLTIRMSSFLKAVSAAQVEFADKLAVIAAQELQRSKAMNTEQAAVYDPYWQQMQLAMRMCRSWSVASKDMTQAMGELFKPMDQMVLVGAARQKETANWNVELNKALSVFHTGVAKRQAKCFKALSTVMTPEYFDQSPAKKTIAVRKAAPTVAKYIEQIEEANGWLARYMSRRPMLMGRLVALENKRLEVSREALATFASRLSSMGQALAASADEITVGVAAINDDVGARQFIESCRLLPTPHLEDPPLFAYTLPVPLSELGIRPVRAPRAGQPAANADTIRESAMSMSAASTNASGVNAGQTGRFSAFSKLFDATKAPAPAPAAVKAARAAVPTPPADEFEEEETEVSVEREVQRFGNIQIRPQQQQQQQQQQAEPDVVVMKTMDGIVPAMRSARRSSGVANASELTTARTA